MINYDEQYIENLIKKLDFINSKNISKLQNNILSDRLTDGDYCDPQTQELIIILLARYNDIIINGENAEAYIDKRNKVIDVINSHLENSIGYDQRYINNLNKEYQEYCVQMGKKPITIEEEYKRNVSTYLPKILEINEIARNEKHVLKLCKEFDLDERIMKYYSASQELFWVENLFQLTEGYEHAVTHNKHTCFWGPFMEKQVFAVDSEHYLQLYHSLESVIENLDVEGVDDPKFKEVKQRMGNYEFLDANGNVIPEDQLGEDARSELDEIVLNKVNETCDGLVNFMNDFQYLLPRAIYGTDGKFLVTRKEFEEMLNPVALINLKQEYDVFFDFMKENGIELTLKEDAKNPTLYELNEFNISEEDMNKVYKYSDEKGNPVKLKYSMIPDDYMEQLIDNGQDVTYDEEDVRER